MSYPTPSPSPGPSPIPPPGDGEDYNYKKFALKRVVDALKQAETDLGADDTTVALSPKSETLTAGLGGENSVWQSPLADTTCESLVEVINSLTSTLQSATDEVNGDWTSEPTYVDEDDSRAKWGQK